MRPCVWISQGDCEVALFEVRDAARVDRPLMSPDCRGVKHRTHFVTKSIMVALYNVIGGLLQVMPF
jgi:hypothetical protein